MLVSPGSSDGGRGAHRAGKVYSGVLDGTTAETAENGWCQKEVFLKAKSELGNKEERV